MNAPRNVILVIASAFVAMVLALSPRSALADDARSDIGAGGEADARSRFVWRGVAWSRGPVAQPSAWLSAAGLSAEVWCNVMLGREGRAPSVVVTSLARDFEWRALHVAPGFVAYDAPYVASGTTAEASLDAELDLDDYALTTSHALDVAGHPLAYLGTAGVEHESEVGRFTLTIGVDLAWANARLSRAYFREAANGPAFVEATIGARWELTSVFYVALHAEGSTLVAPALRRIAEPTLGSAGATFGFEL